VDDDVRQIFRAELSGLPEPQLGTLVQDSLRQGRRMRATRRIYGAVVVAGAVAVGAAMAAQAGAGSPLTNRLATPASRDAPGRATPEGVLAVLLEDLPAGKTSHYAKASNGDLHVQAFLDDGPGPGLVRLSVLDPAAFKAPQPSTKVRTRTLPSGNILTVATAPEDCVRTLHVAVKRLDGLVVSVDVGSCLAWGGFLLGQGRVALTEQQAIEIADDPRLGFGMSGRLIEAGSKRFPDLARFD
jgi:hypothetical protein